MGVSGGIHLVSRFCEAVLDSRGFTISMHANLPTTFAMEFKIKIEWDPGNYRLDERFFLSCLYHFIHKHAGVVGGACLLEMLAFDPAEQTATVQIFPETQIPTVRNALFFASRYQDRKCRISIR